MASPIDENKDLCAHLLKSLTASIPLQVLPSKISGTGLFTTQDIAAGENIFTSIPLVNCVEDGKHGSVCDYCFANSRSAVHPAGRFRKEGDERPEVKLCVACRAVGYCSKECQRIAWKAYHKHECKIFKERPTLRPSARALYRLVNEYEKGLLSAENWEGLNMLKSHELEHLTSENFETIVVVSTHAKEATGTKLSIGDVVSLYCRLLTNTMSIWSAEGQMIGSCLDIVGSLMNHCCDPNAFVFHEGRELRVRSLKHIGAGEEITQSYYDVDTDVLPRRKGLQEKHFFVCDCTRCEDELAGRISWALGDMPCVERLGETQSALLDLMNAAIRASNESGEINTEGIIPKLKAVRDQAFPNSEWPRALQPLPLVDTRVAAMYKAQSNYLEAFRYGIRGCLPCRKSGPNWVHHLFDLVQHFVPLVVQPNESALFKDKKFVTRKEIWDVYHGYLRELAITANKVFGANTTYSKAIKRWWDEAMESAGKPRPGTAAFARKFGAAQRKLLEWAEMEEGGGIELSK